MLETTAWTVFLFAGLTAVATGLGALPLAFLRGPRLTVRWLAVANAIAIGLMAAASWSLIYEGLEYSAWRTLVGMLAGTLLIAVSRSRMGGDEEVALAGVKGADARKVLLIVAIMTAHSFTEGIGVGVSFGGGRELGTYITAAIAVHNIPEGLAISLVMVPRGASVLRAALWSIFSSLPQPLMAVPSFWFVETFEPFLPVGLGFAAGAMIWMIFSELVPDAIEEESPNLVATVVVLSVAAMTLFQQLLQP